MSTSLFVGLLICFPSTAQLILENTTVNDTQTIESTNAIHVQNNYTVAPLGGNLTLKSANEIRLKPDFVAKAGSVFIAKIDDSDADGLLDSWEIQHFGTIEAYTASDDPDKDGLSNQLEYLRSSNPNNPGTDIDRDGLHDDYELFRGLVVGTHTSFQEAINQSINQWRCHRYPSRYSSWIYQFP